ncbi:Ppx/GppA phosphatase family protein [Streptomyces sp. TP-A0874]|uniref:Ppx/GppA phosphatase family protein n=1 Tax=Streptomyces sp. TP-A0874 TaxID=549819 RepID=UPI000853CA36|nr:exopolyphosphatase [Streptomyces sp. TP-A0874]
MRLGVLDVGSNTVHLLMVDAYPGAPPLPAHSHKTELRLAEHLRGDGTIGPEGVDRLVAAVTEAVREAEEHGVEELLALVTSAVREAPNADEVLARTQAATGVRPRVLSGGEEAQLTFLAARRWFGWSAGRLLLLDIGGGSLEIAHGADEEPDKVVSLPLGAGRLTGSRLTGDPPDPADVRAVRRLVRVEIGRTVGEFARFGRPDLAVAASRTFRQLARITGAARASEGIHVPRSLHRRALAPWVPRLAGMSARQRAALPGVSRARARQLPAGALVAEAAMDLFGVDEVEICPWALREGAILRRMEQLSAV